LNETATIIHELFAKAKLSSATDKVVDIRPVSGGDINYCYAVCTSAKKWFVKLNRLESLPGLMKHEADGLLALRQVDDWAPKPIWVGEYDQYQALILPWLETTRATTSHWEFAGRKLAIQHQVQGDYFGWHDDNFIATIPQINKQTTNWKTFYTEHRLLHLFGQARERGYFKASDERALHKLCSRIDDIFPKEPPSLLHGDLWSGNILACGKLQMKVIDPAVYFGYREMDLGMSLLFGGFNAAFYQAYQEVYPLEAGWEDRVPITQLYPLLVHVLLFGDSYEQSVKHVLKRFS